jgi:transcription elongation factor Elf1
MITNCKHCNSDNLIMRIENGVIGLYCKDCEAWLQTLTPAGMRKYKMRGIELEGYY